MNWVSYLKLSQAQEQTHWKAIALMEKHDTLHHRADWNEGNKKAANKLVIKQQFSVDLMKSHEQTKEVEKLDK